MVGKREILKGAKGKLQGYLEREDFEMGRFMWLVAEKYSRDQDRCIVIDNTGEPTHYAPLEEPELLFSFAKLAAHGKPSDNKILRWVDNYGLPRAYEWTSEPEVDEWSDHTEAEEVGFWLKAGERSNYVPRGGAYTSKGEINQRPMLIDEFAARAIETHSALNLHADLIRGCSEDLVKRLEKLSNYQEKGKQISNMDARLIEQWTNSADGGPARLTLLWVAETELMRFISGGVSYIRPTLISSYSATATKGHTLAQGWKCPDLLAAIYLQLYLLVTGSHPLRRCKNPSCELPFPLTRKNRKFCCSSCRSGIRRHRA